MQMATSRPPAREGADPVSPLILEASAETLADLRQVAEELANLAKLHQVQTAAHSKELAELAKLQQVQTVAHTKTHQWLAEVKTELAELQLGQSQASHIATLQLQLAEKDAALAEKHAALVEKDAAGVERDAALVEKDAAWATEKAAWAEEKAAWMEADNARRMRMSVPVHGGEEWHEVCVAWLRSIGLLPTDTHRIKKSANVIITLPGRPDLRILVDFKSGALHNKPAELTKLASDFHGLSTGPTKCDFAMLMYQEGEIGRLNDNGKPTNVGYLVDARVSSNFSGSGWEGCLRADRTYICDRTTFCQALNRMIESMPGGAPAFQVMEGLVVTALTISASVLDAKIGALVVAAAAVGDHRGEFNKLKVVQTELQKYLADTQVAYLNNAEDTTTVVTVTTARPASNIPTDTKRWTGSVALANEVRGDRPALELPRMKKRPRPWTRAAASWMAVTVPRLYPGGVAGRGSVGRWKRRG